ncbi:hypothetical protein QAD02_004089 [Eretmocerus hayati]|uniref:Uncharacterized protein n=1 Tax=Eretmocerus hayati TaxID=131215 RepID=A0ACC2NR85_9HYME|nr:hypothetical protein QAD02_004089 [Eretmocerus hayati]
MLHIVMWVAFSIFLIYAYSKFVIFTHWKRMKVPHESPNLIFGNLNLDFLLNKITVGGLVKQLYGTFKNEKLFGMYIFHNPILVINDPDLIKEVLVKDFQYFKDKGVYYNHEIDPISSNLFRLPGRKWKVLRTRMTPLFTSGKLKQMYPLVLKNSKELVAVCNEALEQHGPLDMKDLIERFMTDSTSNIAFGINCNSLRNPDDEFRSYAKIGTNVGKYTSLLGIFGSNILDFFKLPAHSDVLVKASLRIFETVVDYRLKQNIVRDDLMNTLMDLIGHKNKTSTDSPDSSDCNSLDKLEAAAQVFLFFMAGAETTSATITNCIYELARNPEIQKKLYKEIKDVTNFSEDLNYDILMNLSYLDMVFNETLRKHSSLPFINRICNEDYKIPETDIQVPKGMRLVVSISGLHSNPDVYPHPDTFDPERFTKENRSKRHPYFFLPFGEGPRVCIAKRIVVLQVKIVVAQLVSNFEFSLSDKTPESLHYSKQTFLQVANEKLYLNLRRR